MRLRLAVLLAACLVTSSSFAAGLTGMGAAIYGNSFSFARANLKQTPVTSITVGKTRVGLQTTRMRDIQKAFGGTIQRDGDASWLCYNADGTNSWFISNAFGGQEFVMMVAVEAATRMPRDCEAAGAAFSPPVFNVPGIGARSTDLKKAFGAAPGSKVSYRADRPGGYSDVAQYLGYVLKGGTVTGVGVGETSIPTAH